MALLFVRNERQALYPPERFEQYVQRLGIDAGDRLVIYARGPLGGMLHAARAWFLFRVHFEWDVLPFNCARFMATTM